MNFDGSSLQSGCRILESGPELVDQAFHDLSRDMNPDLVHVFLDKLQRYAAKPDRALFLARYQDSYIAFASIIDYSPPPENVSESARDVLKNRACITGLMVLPEFRHQRVATTLIHTMEDWATKNNRDGVWLITRQMAGWYQRCFQYRMHGTLFTKGVQKNILTKRF